MIKLPYWHQLPDLDLYLDQVLILINDLIVEPTLSEEKGLTASMINNYVKHHHIEKPIKKKYRKRQVARLIAITFLKNVFPIQHISQTLKMLSEDYYSETLYNGFVKCLAKDQDNEMEVPAIIQSACQTVILYYQTQALIADYKGEKNNEHDTI